MILLNKPTCVLTTLFILLFNGCTPENIPATQGGFYYKNIYFGAHRSPSYQQGVQDGCTTATGEYTKSHTEFNTNEAYNDGWFSGRRKCRNLLKIDENGDLIL